MRLRYRCRRRPRGTPPRPAIFRVQSSAPVTATIAESGSTRRIRAMQRAAGAPTARWRRHRAGEWGPQGRRIRRPGRDLQRVTRVSPRSDSNRRPTLYESVALPLSYSGRLSRERGGGNVSVARPSLQQRRWAGSGPSPSGPDPQAASPHISARTPAMVASVAVRLARCTGVRSDLPSAMAAALRSWTLLSAFDATASRLANAASSIAPVRA